jgi:hypothetical protein
VSSRGVYRGIFSALPDDPEFQQLPANARLALYTVRLCRQAGPAAIFRYYPAVLAAQTGLSPKALEAALTALEAGRWIEREGVVLWVRNGLRYDPHVRLADPKQRKGILAHVASLPKLQIVLNFCDYYELPRPFEGPSEGLRIRDRDRDKKKLEETRVPSTTPPTPSPHAEEAVEGMVWAKPENLVALYNAEAPDNVPAVEELSPKRREKAARALRQYASQAWWKEVFAQYHRSRFLRGLTKPAEGHSNFRPDFDWLLSTGRSGVENYVRVHDGVYADG